MLIIPAIDLKEGRCVRLRQGRMEDDTVFSDDPVAVARQWVEAGARRLHLVDLDGAFAGKPRNAEVVMAITAAFPELPVQIGGGIRNHEIADSYVEAGVSFLIIGTQAVKEPAFVDALCRRHPGKVIVGLDARDGFVATEGWAEASSVAAIELAGRFENAGVQAIVYTDIARDGMMQGANVEATAELAAAISIPVIASGGVSSDDDLDRLLARAETGIVGAIVGRALYEGGIDLASAQARLDARSGA
ncbi:MAG: 1-(5-phosphoribosyl)-5-[(5-phosphoribosylamino)methylideneamino]imidazole-4-carboxamide isomerase [Gammaproteobacteria bacterium]|nr:MAG: 1-(5-phosphoribosyl)-5-[(5-phosphoribosylamino)methylideneamino]imidazole-4-carboxamide isomerase [Gammaproteobacteria bacterium]PIE35557.1 MAG: 1-(5-phosphoribosyl)-5-[(5-phosphoribosylamino)methylideneamino]imidazole-4-carboxamide isomerase [Gammaproteobacteria bacterium]